MYGYKVHSNILQTAGKGGDGIFVEAASSYLRIANEYGVVNEFYLIIISRNSGSHQRYIVSSVI